MMMRLDARGALTIGVVALLALVPAYAALTGN